MARKKLSDDEDPWLTRPPVSEHDGDTFAGPLTGSKIPVQPVAPPRSLWRMIVGLLMAVVSTLMTLIALTSDTTRRAFINDWYTFFGWFVGTLIMVGIPWTITYFLLRAPRPPRQRKTAKSQKTS